MSEFSIVISRTEYTHVMVKAEHFFDAMDIAEEMVKENMLEWEMDPETYHYDVKEMDEYTG